MAVPSISNAFDTRLTKANIMSFLTFQLRVSFQPSVVTPEHILKTTLTKTSLTSSIRKDIFGYLYCSAGPIFDNGQNRSFITTANTDCVICVLYTYSWHVWATILHVMKDSNNFTHTWTPRYQDIPRLLLSKREREVFTNTDIHWTNTW